MSCLLIKNISNVFEYYQHKRINSKAASFKAHHDCNRLLIWAENLIEKLGTDTEQK